MKKFLSSFLSIALVLGAASSFAQFTFTSSSKTYSEDFDGMGATGTALPTHWSAINAIANTAITTVIVGNGSGNAGGVYNLGETNKGERALGSLGSGSVIPRIGTRFVNSTGDNIKSMDFDFYVEQWRTGSSNTANEKLIFEYSTDATSLSTGTWFAYSPLDAPEILTSSTSSSAVDGNSIRTQIKATLDSLTWPDGGTLWIRWSDANDPGNDAALALDDLSIKVTNGPVTKLPTLNLSTSFLIVPEGGRILFNLLASSAWSDTITAELGVATLQGAATASPDDIANFSSRTLKIAPGQTSLLVSINTTGDNIPENDEYITFAISNATNANIGTTNQITVFIKDNDRVPIAPSKAIELELLRSFSTGTPGSNSSEIVAYDSASKQIFSVNSLAKKVDIVSIANPRNPVIVKSIGLDTASESGVNSVAAKNGLIAIAIEAKNPQQNGKIVFVNANGDRLKTITAGAMPDHISFTPDGKFVLTANEGEPNSTYTDDPEGSVTIVDVSGGINSIDQSKATTIVLNKFTAAQLQQKNVRLFGPNFATAPAKDLEPEYITFSADSKKAYVTLQENNAVAIIDIATKTLTDIVGMGAIDVDATPTASFDASDAASLNGEVLLAQWPVKALFLPDAIASYSVGGKQYLITANEGDTRDYNAFSEEARVGDATYKLDPSKFPAAAILKRPEMLGRLLVTNKTGDTDNDGDFDEIYSIGTRSFTIWEDNAGTLSRIFDSGNAFERITSEDTTWNKLFNANNGNSVVRKDRSDAKGPEPEGVTTAEINGRHYAFICLERIGGVMVYDVTNPAAPSFVQYVNNRTPANVGDRGAEGIIYVRPLDSPIDTALILVGNETSSTISIFKVKNVGAIRPPAAPTELVATTDSTAKNKLTWKDNAINETNYVVERAIKGTSNFTVLTETLPANTTTYTDATSVNKTEYTYRVKAVNAGGSSAYATADVLTALEGYLLQTTAVFPNPAKNAVFIGMENDLMGIAQITLYSVDGRSVATDSFQKSQVSALHSLSTAKLAPGTYILEITLQNAKTTRRLVIE